MTAALSTNGLSKHFGAFKAVSDVTLSFPHGTRHALIGPNGAGKTALSRMITGQERPDGGTLRAGETVRLAYVDQSRDALQPDRTVWEAISEGQETLSLGGRTVSSRGYGCGDDAFTISGCGGDVKAL